MGIGNGVHAYEHLYGYANNGEAWSHSQGTGGLFSIGNSSEFDITIFFSVEYTHSIDTIANDLGNDAQAISEVMVSNWGSTIYFRSMFESVADGCMPGSGGPFTNGDTVSASMVVPRNKLKFLWLHLDSQGMASASPVNQPPIASFTYSPVNPIVGQEIAFDASSSEDPDGDPLTYQWDFDASDGIGLDSTELNPTHTYLVPGTYAVTLVVNDGKVDSTPSVKTLTAQAIELHSWMLMSI